MKTQTHVLLIGYSNIARKRLINYFIKKKIKFSVASKSYKDRIKYAFKQYKSYEKALKDSKANIIYISLPNSLHYIWAKKALKHGFHVLVDKPICDKLSNSIELVNLAKKKNRLISEAIFFNYHKQIKKSLEITGGKKNISKINVNFTIPKPQKGSILLSKKLKGGVIMDMGPYAASIHRIFFNTEIIKKKFYIKLNKKKLPIEMYLKIYYKNKIYNGTFKFGGNYKNQINIFSKKYKIKINRAFSPPENNDLYLDIYKKNLTNQKIIKKDNCFGNYFNKILNSINKKNYLQFYNQILSDHKFRNYIINQ